MYHIRMRFELHLLNVILIGNHTLQGTIPFNILIIETATIPFVQVMPNILSKWIIKMTKLKSKRYLKSVFQTYTSIPGIYRWIVYLSIPEKCSQNLYYSIDSIVYNANKSTCTEYIKTTFSNNNKKEEEVHLIHPKRIIY